MSTRFGDGRVFQLRVLSGLLSEFRNEVDAHAWTEDDLLFPVLAACENPTVLSTTLTSDRLLRLVDSLAADHVRIRQVLARHHRPHRRRVASRPPRCRSGPS